MKNIFLCFVLTSISFCTAHAQLQQGAKIVGGDMGFFYSPGEQSTVYGSINPYVEYFIVDDLAVGGSFRLSYRVSENAQGLNTFLHTSLYPSVRYFVFTGEKLKPFVHIGMGYYSGISRLAHAGEEAHIYKSSGLSSSAGVGATQIIAENVALVGSLNYIRFFPRGAYEGGTQISFGFGFQIFIP